MNQTATKDWKGEMLVSTRKIWCNVRKYWLLGVGIMAACAAVVVLMTYREYRADLASAAIGTFQGESLIYIDSKDEDYVDAYAALLYSERIRTQVDQALRENGYEKFNKKLDTANVDMKGTSMCYRVIVRSIGYDRTLFLAQTYTELLLHEARDIMGLKGEIIDEPVMTTYINRASGGVEISDLEEPIKIKLSVRSFLTWKKLMILGAGFFLWCAFVMVKVFYDCTLRTRGEVDQLSMAPCFCEIRTGSQESCDLLAALLGGVGERLTGQSEKTGGPEQNTACRILLVSPEQGGSLSDVYEKVKAALQERHAAVELLMAEGAAVSARTLDQAREADGVFLYVSIDRDNANSTHQAFINLSTVGASLYGYVAAIV